jgi:hypothetical protein
MYFSRLEFEIANDRVPTFVNHHEQKWDSINKEMYERVEII